MNKLLRAALSFSLLSGALLGGARAAAYTVQASDTLRSIADRYAISVADLLALNPGLGVFKVGAVLEVPDAVKEPVQVEPPPPQPQEPPVQPPALPAPVRVTAPPCCPAPSWSADGRQVLFLYRAPGGPTGLYAVPADGSDTRPTFVRAPAFLSPDGAFALVPASANEGTAVRLADGRRVRVPTSGVDAVWSPGGQLAWGATGQAERDDQTPLRVFTADLGGDLHGDLSGAQGSAPRALLTVYGGWVVAWLDEDTLLVAGKTAPGERQRSLLRVNVNTGAATGLARGAQLSGVRASPDGAKVAYTVTHDQKGSNGVFVVSLGGTGGAVPVRLPSFGSYRWRDSGHLLVIPLEPGVRAHRVVELSVEDGSKRELLSLQDKVATDQWSVSPDGGRLLFVSAGDLAVHVVALPASTR